MQLFKKPSLRALLAAAALAVGLVAPVFAGINRWTSNGPYGGNVGVLVVDPAQPQVAYVGIPRYGVFKSADGGTNWAAANEGLSEVGSAPVVVPLLVRALAIDPLNPSTLYAGLQEGGAFKSTDGAATWRRLQFESVFALAVDPRNPSTVYASADSSVFRSMDGGATWQQSPSLPPLVGSLAMDPAHPDVLYVLARDVFADSKYIVFRTQDGGGSWAPVASPSPGVDILGVSVDRGSRIFASTELGVFRSGDAGATWTRVLDGSFGSVTPIGPSQLYVAGSTTSSGPFPSQALRSTDGGDHWTQLSFPMAPPSVFASSTAEPATVYGGASSGVFKSTDGGETWTSSNNGIQALPAGPVTDPGNHHLVYGESTGGLFRSDDDGASWSLRNPDPQLSSVSIQPGSLSLYSSLGRSVDGGSNWQPVPYPQLTGAALGAPVIVPDSPETLFLAAGGYPPDPAEIFKSADGGASWALSFAPTSASYVDRLLVSKSGARLYASYSGRFQPPRFSRSDDGGTTWNPLEMSGWPDDWFYAAVLIGFDPLHPDVVFSGVRGKLYLSLIGGGQWVEIGAGLPAPQSEASGSIVSSIVVDPTAPAILYASTEQGVFRSLDQGAHWTNFSDGLPATATFGLVIDASGRFLHVGTIGGIYDMEIRPPCAASASALCLLEGRFTATVVAVDPRSGHSEAGRAVPQADRFGYFSLPGFTGDPTFPEVVVKMADATSFGGGFWLFHTGLTDLQYTLSIVDTATGRQKDYSNDRSDPQSLCGGADTTNFADVPVEEQLTSPRRGLAGAQSTSLTLLDRFDATLSVVDPRTGGEADGVAVAQGAKWGYFSLPAFTNDPAFPEVFVKMVDATALPGGYFWVFHTGLTDLEYTLTEKDRDTGAQRVYRNDRSDPSRLCGAADTKAFQ